MHSLPHTRTHTSCNEDKTITYDCQVLLTHTSHAIHESPPPRQQQPAMHRHTRASKRADCPRRVKARSAAYTAQAETLVEKKNASRNTCSKSTVVFHSPRPCRHEPVDTQTRVQPQLTHASAAAHGGAARAVLRQSPPGRRIAPCV